MPPAYEVLLLNTAVPQIQAAQSGDTYVVPRDIAFSAALTLSAGTANGVPYLNGSKVLTSGSALAFDGTNFFGGTNTYVTGRFYAQRSSSSLNLPIAGYTDGSPGAVLTGTKGDIVAFGNAGGDGVIFANANTEQMRLTSTGLGIGTTSPAGKLSVTTSTMTNQIIADSMSDSTTYGLVSLNATRSSTGYLGIAGGGGTDKTLFLNVPTGGKYSFRNNFSEQMTLDSSGNLGLGVTPSGSWGSPALMLGKPSAGNPTYPFLTSTDTQQIVIGSNSYWDGTNWKAAFAGSPVVAMQQRINYNQISWHTASAVGQNTTQSFTQAMTLDASGNLLLGETARAYLSRFTLSYDPSSTNGPIFLDNRAFGIDRGGALWIGGRYNSSNDYRPFGGITARKENATDGNSAGYLTFHTNGNAADPTERARIKSTGQFRFVPLAADPSGAEAGDVYYNSGTNKLRLYDGTSWVDLN